MLKIAELLPNLSSGQWTIHPRATVTGTDELTLNAPDVWKNSLVTVAAVPGNTYRLTVENPNRGTILAYEINSSGGEALIIEATETFVDRSFKTGNNTQKIRVVLSNGRIPSGNFVFRNPTLDGASPPPPPTDLLPDLSSGQWTIHMRANVTGTDELTLQPPDVWKNSFVSVSAKPSNTYRLTVENPNRGTILAYEINGSGGETLIVEGTETTVDHTFTTSATTQQIKVVLSNGRVPTGTFVFRNPTLLGASGPPPPPTTTASPPPTTTNPPPSQQQLRVSPNKRFLVNSNGTPFFWMADTGWNLLIRHTPQSANNYLQNRKDKRFNVIQASILNRFTNQNINGDAAVLNNNINQPNPAYYSHIDSILQLALQKGIYIAALPVWGANEVEGRGVSDPWLKPSFQNQGLAAARQKAYNHGKFLGNRYKNYPNIIWVIGGDTNPNGAGSTAGNYADIYRDMVRGIKDGEAGGISHLMTYHPQYQNDAFHSETWLDFQMTQSSHYRDKKNYLDVRTMYNLSPIKPAIDGEPRYEDHPDAFNAANGYLRDFDVRQGEYWALFAGAFGITYGQHNVWQSCGQANFTCQGQAENRTFAQALDRPGAFQMTHLRKLMESRPFLSRIPDQALMTSAQPSTAGAYTVATRDSNGSYAFIYCPYGGTFTVNLSNISGTTIRAFWYNPKTGVSTLIGTFSKTSTRTFTAPGTFQRGNDWVLIIDDAQKGYSAP